MSFDYKVVFFVCIRASNFVYIVNLLALLKGELMSVEIIFKIAGIGLITAIVNQILKHLGKEEIASVTTLAGLIICLLMVLDLVQDLLNTVKNLFSF